MCFFTTPQQKSTPMAYCPNCGSSDLHYEMSKFDVPVGECLSCGEDWDADEEEWERWQARHWRNVSGF